MKNRKLLVSTLVLPLLCTGACGLEQALQDLNDSNATAPGTSLGGTVSGQPLAAQTAIYATSNAAPGPSKNATLVLLGSQSNLCEQISSNIMDANSTLTAIYMEDVSAGEFSAMPAALLLGRGAIVGISNLDSNCKNTIPTADATASGGSVNLTRVDQGNDPNGQAYGTFDLTVGAQNANVTGSFQATYCPGLANMQSVLTAGGVLPTVASGEASGFTCVNPNSN